MKQELTEALALWDSAPDWNDSNTTPKEWQVAYSLFAAAARLVERLLPGECPLAADEPDEGPSCQFCHGSGQVWDEGIVKAVRAQVGNTDHWDFDSGFGCWTEPSVDAITFAVLSALAELLTEKVKS